MSSDSNNKSFDRPVVTAEEAIALAHAEYKKLRPLPVAIPYALEKVIWVLDGHDFRTCPVIVFPHDYAGGLANALRDCVPLGNDDRTARFWATVPALREHLVMESVPAEIVLQGRKRGYKGRDTALEHVEDVVRVGDWTGKCKFADNTWMTLGYWAPLGYYEALRSAWDWGDWDTEYVRLTCRPLVTILRLAAWHPRPPCAEEPPAKRRKQENPATGLSAVQQHQDQVVARLNVDVTKAKKALARAKDMLAAAQFTRSIDCGGTPLWWSFVRKLIEYKPSDRPILLPSKLACGTSRVFDWHGPSSSALARVLSAFAPHFLVDAVPAELTLTGPKGEDFELTLALEESTVDGVPLKDHEAWLKPLNETFFRPDVTNAPDGCYGEAEAWDEHHAWGNGSVPVTRMRYRPLPPVKRSETPADSESQDCAQSCQGSQTRSSL